MPHESPQTTIHRARVGRALRTGAWRRADVWPPSAEAAGAPMKALTICQPYAWLIARGDKRIENRTWPTPYRGPLAIHAGKSRAWMNASDARAYGIASGDLVFGAVIATATLVDCVRYEDLPASLQTEHASGPWCWVLATVRRMDPVPCGGARGLWEWSR